MARAGVTVNRIVDVAVAVADQGGLEQVTLAAIAAELGIRVPSLYKHVSGLEAVLALLAERCREMLVEVVEAAIADAPEGDALPNLAIAIRAWALAHPSWYAATVKGQVPGEAPTPATKNAMTLLIMAMGGNGDESDQEVIHRARALRARIHGFIDLELRGGFGLPVGIDESFAWMLRE